MYFFYRFVASANVSFSLAKIRFNDTFFQKSFILFNIEYFYK